MAESPGVCRATRQALDEAEALDEARGVGRGAMRARTDAEARLGGARAAAVYALEWAPLAATTVGPQHGTEGASDAAQHEGITMDAVAQHRPAGQQPMPGQIPAWSLH
jgi:hypothetical protein